MAPRGWRLNFSRPATTIRDFLSKRNGDFTKTKTGGFLWISMDFSDFYGFLWISLISLDSYARNTTGILHI